MYDSPLNDWRPGRLLRVGFPWHGKVELDTNFTGLPARLQLPNGAVMQLPYVPSASSVGRWQSGSTFAFRDPRAVAVELSETEAEQAEAAGAVWQPEVIINELQIAGGVQHRADPLTWFVYHDGEKNWIASVSASLSINFQSTPVIKRGDAETERASVSATRTFEPGADQSPITVFGSASVVVIDALPDGSRVLLAKMAVRAGGSDNEWKQRNERWEAVAFYELRVSGPGSAPTAVVDLLYGKSDIEAGYSYSETNALGRWTAIVATGFEWSTYAAGETAISSATFPLDDAGPFSGAAWYESGSLTRREEQTRVVSMYYGPDKSIRRIVYQYALSSDMVYDTSYGGASQPAIGEGQGGPVFGIRLISPGYHEHTVTEQRQITSSLTASLIDDGVSVSSITSTGSSTSERHMVTTVEVEAGDDGNAFTSLTGTRQVAGSWERTTEFDGEVVDSVSGSASGSNWNTAIRDVSPVNLSQSNAWSGGWGAEFELDANPGYQTRRMSIIPQHYTLQMHCLGFTVWDVNNAKPYNITNTLSTVACRGLTVAGRRTGPLPAKGYFGSHNPVTGQTLRDTSTPITYI